MAYITSVETQSIVAGECLTPPIATIEAWPSLDPQGIASFHNLGMHLGEGILNQLGLANTLGLLNKIGINNAVGFNLGVGGQVKAEPSYSESSLKLDLNSPLGDLRGYFQYNGSNICAPCPSDQRAKINISTLQNSLDKVLKLRGVSFNWNEEVVPRKAASQSSAVGLIAQEVEEIIPEVVVQEQIEDQQLKTVEYGNLVGVLVEAIKEQQEQINSLKETVQELSTKLAECCP